MTQTTAPATSLVGTRTTPRPETGKTGDGWSEAVAVTLAAGPLRPRPRPPCGKCARRLGGGRAGASDAEHAAPAPTLCPHRTAVLEAGRGEAQKTPVAWATR